jgi:hypothetical protein
MIVVNANGTAQEYAHENLLAVTQSLAGMRYNDSILCQLWGGPETMIESRGAKGLGRDENFGKRRQRVGPVHETDTH